MRRKIVWHYPHLKFRMGGTKFIYEVASVINNSKKHKVEFVCNLGEKSILEEFKSKGSKVNTISRFSTNNFIYWALLPLSIIYDTYKSFFYLKNADIIIATVFPSNLVCAIACLFLKKNYYYYCFEPYPFFHNHEYINDQPLTKKWQYRLLSFLYGWSDIWATRKAKRVFTLDPPKRELIKKVYKISSIVTSVGIDTTNFKPYPNNRIKKQYHDKIIITHSTDYTPLKRTDLAIKTIKHLVKRFPNILLFITSTKPNSSEKHQYETLIKKLELEKNVKLLDFVPYNDLPLYYSASLCYLSTSYNKMTCTNLPVKEAAACHVPTIRADVKGEIDVTNNNSGFIVNTKNPTITAEKIEYLINHPKEAKRMGNNAYLAVSSRYSWDKVTKAILDNLK